MEKSESESDQGMITGDVTIVQIEMNLVCDMISDPKPFWE